jgi:hypothetical protein
MSKYDRWFPAASRAYLMRAASIEFGVYSSFDLMMSDDELFEMKMKPTNAAQAEGATYANIY